MFDIFYRQFAAITIGALAFSLASCTSVVNSVDRVSLIDGNCHSRLGAYSLPKTNLKITIKKYFVDTADAYVMEQIDYERRADPHFTYCLDYLASATSDDAVQVKRNKSSPKAANSAGSKDPWNALNADKDIKATPFLQLITSKSVDQSAIIVRKLIRTLFIGLSQNAAFTPRSARDGKTTPDPPVLAAELEFDPFDPVEVADVNSRLKELGFCVVLEDYTFDRQKLKPSHYCDSPRRMAKLHPSIAAELVANQPRLAAPEVRGIHYRPRAAYQLSIYTKDDPGGPEPWRLSLIKSVELENASPIMSLAVDRAIFASRRTAIVFEDGALQQVCIAKGSEMLGFVEIPVELINSLVALPTEMLKVQIESASLNSDVIKAENEVIKLQKQYIDYKLRGGQKPNVSDDPKYIPLPAEAFPSEGLPVAQDFPNQQVIVGAISADTNADRNRLNDICPNLGTVNAFATGDNI